MSKRERRRQKYYFVAVVGVFVLLLIAAIGLYFSQETGVRWMGVYRGPYGDYSVTGSVSGTPMCPPFYKQDPLVDCLLEEPN